jgi:hypothetical protein
MIPTAVIEIQSGGNFRAGRATEQAGRLLPSNEVSPGELGRSEETVGLFGHSGGSGDTESSSVS